MNKLIKQIVNFIGISGLGWILDFMTYSVLAFLSINLFLCNVIGAVAGVSFVFIFSTRFVFDNKSIIPLFVKYLVYIAYQVVLVYLISLLLVSVNSYLLSCTYFNIVREVAAIISKILVTPITMILNFIILKNIIEKM